MTAILAESVTAELVDEDLALAAAREAFLAAANGITLPVVRAPIGPDGGFSVKSGASGGLVALKVGSYDELGTPRHCSTIVLLDAMTGRVEAVVEAAAANAYRTAAADALSIQTLARADARVLTVFGTGQQAIYDVRAASRVRPIDRVLVVGRRHDAAAELADKVSAELDVQAEVASPASGVAEADIVITATTAREPLFHAEWVAPGTHISAMGADGPGKQELPPGLYDFARLFCDALDQSREIGEFQHAPDRSDISPLGDVLAGKASGRGMPEEVTVFDSSGFALQDLSLATALLHRHQEMS